MDELVCFVRDRLVAAGTCLLLLDRRDSPAEARPAPMARLRNQCDRCLRVRRTLPIHAERNSGRRFCLAAALDISAYAWGGSVAGVGFAPLLDLLRCGVLHSCCHPLPQTDFHHGLTAARVPLARRPVSTSQTASACFPWFEIMIKKLTQNL